MGMCYNENASPVERTCSSGALLYMALQFTFSYLSQCCLNLTFTYPLTAGLSGGHLRWFPNQFLPFFSVLHCPLGLGKLHLFCLPTSFSVCLVFFPLSLCLARWFWPDLMNGRHDHTTTVCISLPWSGGPHVVQLPAGSWHRLPHW